MKRSLAAILSIMILGLFHMVWAGPQSLSDEEMEEVFAKGIAINGTQVGLADSAVASDSSSAVDDVSGSTLQVGSGLTETGQNQLNNENATVKGGDSTVINMGGDNREQVNLNKTVYVTEGAQSDNEGIIGNTTQGIFLQPINAISVQASTVNSNMSQHNTTTILSVHY